MAFCIVFEPRSYSSTITLSTPDSIWILRAVTKLSVTAVTGMPGIPSSSDGESDGEQDELYDEAVAFVSQSRRASISAVQRRLRIGYNRAARLIEAMEVAGLVSEMNSNGNREVLAPNNAE